GMRYGQAVLWAILLIVLIAGMGRIAWAEKEAGVKKEVPENVYKGELVSFPGPWAFQIGKAGIILVSDQEMEALADPDKVLNLTLTYVKHEASLRQVCERAKAAGQRTL